MNDWKKKLVEAATAILKHVEAVAGTEEAEKLLEQVVQGIADGVVEGIEIASAALPGGALIVSGEKMVLPWGERKVVASVDGVIESLFDKLRAKLPAPVPAPAQTPASVSPVVPTPESAAKELGAV